MKDEDETNEHSIITRIVGGIIIFAVLGFLIKFGVEAVLSVKIPLLIIAIVLIAIIIAWRIYKYRRDHNDY